jgi:tetratricopeptide (TPR) repeat protein
MNKVAKLKRLADDMEWSALEKFLRDNLAELIVPAIEIAYEKGVVATILARLIQESEDVQLLGDTYNYFHNGFTTPSGLPRFPAGNVAFGEVAIAIGRKALDIALKIARDEPGLSRMRSEGVPLFTNLAGWHAIVGQHGEAATVAREAVAFFAHGAASDHPAEVAGFAGALDTLLATLRPLGLEQEADEAGRGAIERYRRLAGIDPAAYGPDLARTLVNWAGGLRGDGSVDIRLASYREAAELYRSARALSKRNFDPELCQTLIGFTSVLVAAERLDEALEAALEGRAIANTLTARRDEAYGRLLVMANTNLALVHQRRGELDEAVLRFDAAVGTARHLHESSPEAFDELFARCLSMTTLALVDKKDLETAFERLDECVRVCSEPGRVNDHVFLASTYTNFAILAWETGRRERVMEGIALAKSELELLSSADPNRIADSYETLRQLETHIGKR